MSSPFVWFDISTTPENAAPVTAFYEELFGWEMNPDEDSDRYHRWITSDGQPWAAVTVDETAVAGNWVPYVQVDNLEAALASAVDLGATVLVEKLEGPAGTSAIIEDPAGAVLSLWVAASA